MKNVIWRVFNGYQNIQVKNFFFNANRVVMVLQCGRHAYIAENLGKDYSWGESNNRNWKLYSVKRRCSKAVLAMFGKAPQKLTAKERYVMNKVCVPLNLSKMTSMYSTARFLTEDECVALMRSIK